MSEKDMDEIEKNFNFETILIENIKKESDAIFSTEQEYSEILTNCDIKSEHAFSATLETDNHISIKEENTNEIDKNNKDNLYEKSNKIMGTLLKETKKAVSEHSLCNSTHKNQNIPNDSNQQSTNTLQCEICSSIFLKKEYLKRHIKRHLNHGRFKCEFCSKVFNSSSDKKRHEKNIHKNEIYNLKEISLRKIEAESDIGKIPDDNNQQSKNTFKCEICSTVYLKQESLNKHLKRHFNPVRFKCEFCSKEFSNNSDKNKHKKTIHKNKITEKIPDDSNEQSTNTYKCEICSSVYLKQESLNRHLERHFNPVRFKCEFCSKEFSTNSEKNIHESCVHKNENCNVKEISVREEIEAESDNEKTLDDSNKQSTNTFKCEICSSVYLKQEYLNRHLKRHSNFGRFKCEFCSKTFSNNSDKNKHEKYIHKSIYSCHICKKVLSSNTRLVSHIKSHRGTVIRPHQCHLCEKSFSDLGNFKCHIRRHLGVKKFECQYCEKAFVSSTERKSHERKHRDEKPFLCPECGKSFITSGQLTNHLRGHSGTKSYKCEKCEKSFYLMSILKDHLLVHSGLKPYQCKICNASFSKKQYMKRHERRHSDKAEYPCKI